VTGVRRRTFPLEPLRPVVGAVFGTQRSLRRGPGSDAAGSRPYRPGDRLSSIDWAASARLSAITGGDEFVVRETYAEDAPRVVVVLDRRPSMGLYGPGLPFLSKPQAAREVVAAIAASARAARAEIGWLDFGGGRATWLPPRNAFPAALVERRLAAPHDGPGDTILQALHHLARHSTEAPKGTFVFLVSDFLSVPPPASWRPAIARGLDLVPVVVQDPVWDASFPDVAGVVLPVAAPDDQRGAGVRLSAAEVAARRQANELRARLLADRLRGFGIDPVIVEAEAAAEIDAAFAAWAARRRLLRRAHG
jgi:uncharacterized protein (DUF58 family)